MTERPRRQRRRAALTVHYRGFGFAEPLDGDGKNNIYLNANLLTGLIDGDIIDVDVTGDTAVHARLIQRGRTHVVGEARRRGKTWILDIDGAIAPQATVTLAGTRGLTEGHSVLAQLTGTHSAVVIEHLGDPTDTTALTRRCLARHNIAHEHPADAVNEAETIAATGQRNRRRRRDLRDTAVITIDADHSQDLDDALHCAPARDGALRVWVHVADVTEYVTAGSALDRAASATPTSVYLKTGARHMLPETLAERRLSLIPRVDRDVVTVELVIAGDGTIRSVDVYEATIRSRQRLNYDQVAALITGDTPQGTIDDELKQQVTMLWAAATRLGLARAARGGLDAARADGDRPVNSDAHLLVERLMVAANEAVADWLAERDMPALYRTHPPLGDDEASELETIARALGLYAALPRPVTPQAMAALAAQATSHRHTNRFWDATMKLTDRARYEPTAGLHFGLGSSRYVHFTSPLRRYADIVVHRSIKAYLAGERDVDYPGLNELAHHVTTVSRNAAAAERDLDRALALRGINTGDRLEAVCLSTRGNQARVMVADVVGILTKSGAAPGARILVTVTVADELTGRLEVERATTSARQDSSGDDTARVTRATANRGTSRRVRNDNTDNTGQTAARAGADTSLAQPPTPAPLTHPETETPGSDATGRARTRRRTRRTPATLDGHTPTTTGNPAAADRPEKAPKPAKPPKLKTPKPKASKTKPAKAAESKAAKLSTPQPTKAAASAIATTHDRRSEAPASDASKRRPRRRTRRGGTLAQPATNHA